ncbi:MAG: hypothetical protein ABIP94_00860 [Planctomycetota bacterium]
MSVGATVRAKYRLQLHAGFGFAAARELVSFLAELGISHMHTSPIVRAREGSTPGYDVVDPTEISPHLGGTQEFEKLGAEPNSSTPSCERSHGSSCTGAGREDPRR